MNNQLDLISIGDASIDVFISPTESEMLCQLDDKQSLICFSYGDKIPVKNLEFSTGGNAANNAVGTTRLGLKVAIVLTVGDDNIGGLITDKLEKEGVVMDYVTKQAGTGSNYSTVINYSGERTIFVYHAPRTYEFPAYLPAAPWVYLTSMGESFEPFYQRVVDWLAQNPEVKLAFNPGSYQVRAKKEVLEPVLERCSVIFVNRQEAGKISGADISEGKEKELLAALRQTGPKTVIVTDGGKGSYVYDGTKYIKAGILPIDAYERTGAGDAFGSGCLSAIIKNKPLDEALVWGTLNSASVIGYVGPQRGLLEESEIEIWKERYVSSEAKVEEF
jgi:ribokinase